MVKYAELWCKTNFSFLEGAAHADELVGRAKELGYEALAITDRNSLAGVVRAHQAARTAALKLLIGAEITPSDGAAVILLAMNLAGYRNLALLITRGRRSAPKGECRLTLSDLADHADNLLAIIPAHPTTTPVALQTHRDIFRERAYLAAAVHLGPCDEDELAHWARQSRLCRLPMVASNQVHYHLPERRALHDVLTAVKNHTTVANLGALRFANGERYLKSPAQLAQLFARYPDAVERTVEVAGRCAFSLDELRYEYPDELCPPGKTQAVHLAELTWAGARALSGRHSREGERPPRTGADLDRGAALRGVFFDGLGPGGVCPRTRHPVPGTRLGR